MSRAIFNRMLLLVHGQPDTMETPLPGYWGRSGGARVDTHEVMKPRPCVLDFITYTELDDETAFPIEREFRGKTTQQKRAEEQAERERYAHRKHGAAQAVVAAVALAAVMAAVMLAMRGGAA